MSIFLRGGVWNYEFVVDGKRYRGSTKMAENQKAEAQKKEDALKVQYREGYSVKTIWEQTRKKLIASKDVPLDYNELWKTFTSKSTSTTQGRRRNFYATHIRDFVEWMKSKYPDVTTVSLVQSDHAREYINQIRKSDGANSTKNDKLATLKMLFEALGKNAGIVENPFLDIKKLPQNQISREAFTLDELKLIGDKAKGWIYSLCLTALSTGLREGDICLLKKKSVNLKSGWITLTMKKTSKPLEVPIMPKLAEHLSEVMQNNDSDYVFPELAQKYQKDVWSIGKEIKEFFHKIGIQDTLKDVKGYARQVSSKDVHSFRHTFVYLAALHNIPLPIVQSIVGHTSQAMTRLYMNHAGREAKVKYFGLLPEYLSGGEIKKQRELTAARVLRMVKKLTPKNLEKNKAKIIKLLK